MDPRATPRRDTRVRGIRAHNRETDFRARTEHNHFNSPGSLKHLKSVALGLTELRHPGHPYYFMIPGGQVFTIAPTN